MQTFIIDYCVLKNSHDIANALNNFLAKIGSVLQHDRNFVDYLLSKSFGELVFGTTLESKIFTLLKIVVCRRVCGPQHRMPPIAEGWLPSPRQGCLYDKPF